MGAIHSLIFKTFYHINLFNLDYVILLFFLYCNNLLPTTSIRFNIVPTLILSTSTTNICMYSFHLDIFFSEGNHEFDYLIRKTSHGGCDPSVVIL